MFSILKKKMLGIDISDRSIEIVLIQKEGLFVEVKAKARLTIDKGVVVDGKIKDESKLRSAFEEVLGRIGKDGEGAREAVFSLPDEACFVHFFETTVPSGDSERDVIEEEARNVIPVEFGRLSYAYKKTKFRSSKGGEKMRVSLIAVDRGYLERWADFFRKSGLEIIRFDVEGLSQRRCISTQTGSAPFLLVDIGSQDSKIFAFDGNGLLYSHSFAIGGDLITEKMAETIRKKEGAPIDLAEAEKVKIEFGMELAGEFSWLRLAVQEALDGVIAEIEKAGESVFNKVDSKPKMAILAGGGANIKGLLPYFKSVLEKKGYDLEIARLSMPATKEDESIFYIEAVGAAMSCMDRKWSKTDPFLEIKNRSERRLFDGAKQGISFFGGFHPFAVHRTLSISVISLIAAIAFSGALLSWKSGPEGGLLAMFGKKEAEIAEREQSLKMSLTVNIRGENVPDGEVKGRIARVVVAKPAAGMDSYEEIMAFAKGEAERQLKEDEVLWQDAVSYPPKKTNLAYPMEFGWLVMDSGSVKANAVTAADGKFKNVLSVGFKDASWDKIRKDSLRPDAYILSGIAVFTVRYQKAF